MTPARGPSRPLSAALAAILFTVLVAPAPAQTVRFFRIATGDASGTLFAVGSAIASAISHPPGSRACERGGSCGVPNLVAVAQSTEGAVENVRVLAGGQVEAALVQADVAYWAYYGTGPFAGEPLEANLRAIANLFPAVVHVVARRDGGIAHISDLVGKRVSLGPRGSGTPENAVAILAAYGLGMSDITASFLDSGAAADNLRQGAIDAFFEVGGVPVNAVDDLARRMPTTLVPIEGAPREEIVSFYPFLSEAAIQAGDYPRVAYTPTVAIGTQLLVAAETDPELVYEITRALWHERTRALLEGGHPQARAITLEHAQDGLAIPLHPGAARYYRERGLLR